MRDVIGYKRKAAADNTASWPVFLEAEWRNLVIVNYAIEPDRLLPFVPAGTELDAWEGAHYISLVGFSFLNTRVKGLAIPFHRNFEEINLRFYVRRRTPEGWRRGVVFIKEIVPKPAIAWIARELYGENYVTWPTRHLVTRGADGFLARYEWRLKQGWNYIAAAGRGEPSLPDGGSEAQFITEHYWGYSAQRNGDAIEYRVEHPSWRLWFAPKADVSVDVEALYGPAFVGTMAAKPVSVFIAEGSAITVSSGRRIQ